MLPADRRFLGFTLRYDHYQSGVLPYGLSSAQRGFSIVLSMVAVHLKSPGIRIYPDLDDGLLQEACRAPEVTMLLFTELGLQISSQKSTLAPVQCLEFIGADLDALQSKTIQPSLPQVPA